MIEQVHLTVSCEYFVFLQCELEWKRKSFIIRLWLCRTYTYVYRCAGQHSLIHSFRNYSKSIFVLDSPGLLGSTSICFSSKAISLVFATVILMNRLCFSIFECQEICCANILVDCYHNRIGCHQRITICKCLSSLTQKNKDYFVSCALAISLCSLTIEHNWFDCTRYTRFRRINLEFPREPENVDCVVLCPHTFRIQYTIFFSLRFWLSDALSSSP